MAPRPGLNLPRPQLLALAAVGLMVLLAGGLGQVSDWAGLVLALGAAGVATGSLVAGALGAAAPPSPIGQPRPGERQQVA